MVDMAIDRDVITEVLASTPPRPMCILISLTSALVTEPSAFTSPTRNVMVADASTELEAPFTPATLTVMSEPSQLTCPSCTVTVLPLNVVLVTLPQVVVEAPEMLVTSSEKVNTNVCRNVPPSPCRHSTPGSEIRSHPRSRVLIRHRSGVALNGDVRLYLLSDNGTEE